MAHKIKVEKNNTEQNKFSFLRSHPYIEIFSDLTYLQALLVTSIFIGLLACFIILLLTTPRDEIDSRIILPISFEIILVITWIYLFSKWKSK